MKHKLKEFFEEYCEVKIGHPTNESGVNTSLVYTDVGIKPSCFFCGGALAHENADEQDEVIFCKLNNIELIDGYRVPSEVSMDYAIERNRFIEKLIK